MTIRNIILVIFIAIFIEQIVCINVTKPNYRIGSFNIQSFGVSKMDKQWVVQILSEIVSKFDIITIQEVRDSSGEVMKQFLQLVNQHGEMSHRKFSIVKSDRLGTTNRHQEQYIFFYDENRVELMDTFQYADEEQTFSRPPFSAKFRLKEASVQEIIIASNHLSPGNVTQELAGLFRAHAAIKTYWNSENIILAGDLNADCSYLSRYEFEESKLRRGSKFDWLINSCHRTTAVRSTCIYDHFIVSGDELRMFGVVPYSAGVVMFDEIYALNYTMALNVSDHYPIEFQIAGKSELSKELDNSVAKVFQVSQKIPAKNLNIIRAVYRSESLTLDQRNGFEILLLKKGSANYKVTAVKEVKSQAMARSSVVQFVNEYHGLLTNDTQAIIKSFFDADPSQQEKLPHSLLVTCHRKGADCDSKIVIQFDCIMQGDYECSFSMKQEYTM